MNLSIKLAPVILLNGFAYMLSISYLNAQTKKLQFKLIEVLFLPPTCIVNLIMRARSNNTSSVAKLGQLE